MISKKKGLQCPGMLLEVPQLQHSCSLAELCVFPIGVGPCVGSSCPSAGKLMPNIRHLLVDNEVGFGVCVLKFKLLREVSDMGQSTTVVCVLLKILERQAMLKCQTYCAACISVLCDKGFDANSRMNLCLNS